MGNNIPLFQRYMIAYSVFFNSDLESSLLYGRNFDIINMFLQTLEMLIDKEVDINFTIKALNQLEIVVNDEHKKYNFIDLKHNIRISDKQRQINELVKYFKKFFESYSLLIEIIDEQKKINDILVEFNNALSHILNAVTNKKSPLNFKRAKSHLYRGVLDCYKEIIQLKSEIIINNPLLEKQFLLLRQKEAKLVGISEDAKLKILNEYFLIINQI